MGGSLINAFSPDETVGESLRSQLFFLFPARLPEMKRNKTTIMTRVRMVMGGLMWILRPE